jgi:hypothetical protein
MNLPFGSWAADFPERYPGLIHPVGMFRMPGFWLLAEQEDNSMTLVA